MAITVQDLLNIMTDTELKHLTSPNKNTINLAALKSAIAVAEDYVDSLLAARFTIPIANENLTLKRIKATFARRYLYRSSVPEYIQNEIDQALQLLEQALEGSLDVGGTVKLSSDITDAELNNSFIYTRETLKRYMTLT